MEIYIFSGLATVHVLFLGGGGGGYDEVKSKISQGRSPFNPVLTVDYTLRHIFQQLFT